IGGGRGVFHRRTQAVMTIIAMAACAIAGEQFRSLDVSIFAQEIHCAAGRNSMRGSKDFNALGLASGSLYGNSIRFVPAVVSNREERQQHHADEQGAQKSDVEPVS